MREFNFTVHVQGLDENNLNQIDVLFEAPFTIQPLFTDEEAELMVSVDAHSDHQAWQTFNRFIADRLPELHIIRIDLDLVNPAEIAERCGVSRETVRLWASGQRRRNFPASFTTAGQSKLWAWADVFVWVNANRLPLAETYSGEPLDLGFVETCNGLRARRRHSDSGQSNWLNAGTVGGQILTFVPRPSHQPWSEFAPTKIRRSVKLEDVG